MTRGATGERCSWATAGVLLLLPVLGGGFDPLRVRNAAVERGNAALAAGRAKDALAAYDEALAEQPDAQGIHYNRGVALQRLGQREAARQALLRATQGEDRALRAKSFYNLGDVLFDEKRFGEAAASFQQALRFDPQHRAAKWNLELALRRREQEKKKEQERQQKKKKKEQQRQKQNDPQKQQAGRKQQEQQPSKPAGDQGARADQQQPQREPAPTPSPAPRETPQQAAERAAKAAAAQRAARERQQVLEALDRNDKTLQREQARRLQGLYRRPAKDW